MKKQLVVAFALVASWAFGGVETITHTLPADYSTAKIVESAQPGMVTISYAGLDAPVENAGAPMLPETFIRLNVPRNGMLLNLTYEASWKTIAENVKLSPIQALHYGPSTSQTFTPPNEALYQQVAPLNQVLSMGIHSAAGKKVMPVKVVPFRYQNGKVEAATSFTVKAEFLVPEQMMAVRQDAQDKGYAKTDPNQPDYIMIAPNRYYHCWEGYIAARQEDHPEIKYALVNLKDILEKFPENRTDSTKGYYARNEAERLHAYIAQEAKRGTHYFVLAGAFYGANPYGYGSTSVKTLSMWDGERMSVERITSENGIPGIYTQPRTAGPEDFPIDVNSMPIPSDTFYACCDIPEGSKYPWDAGGYNRETGNYDFNPEGNGEYLDEADHEGVSPVDLMPDVVVTRISFKMNCQYWSNQHPTYQSLVDGFLAKVRRAEQTNFPGRRKYAATLEKLGGYGTFKDIPNDVRTETEYYTGSYNMFDPKHNSTYNDTEVWGHRVLRDRCAKYFPSVHNEMTTEGTWPIGMSSRAEGLASYPNQDWEFFFISSHGVQSGMQFQSIGNHISSVMPGLIKTFAGIIPCLTGYPDWDPGNKSGDTVYPSNAESLIENPNGGATYAIGSAREGWYAYSAPDIENGDGMNSRIANYYAKGYFNEELTPGDSLLYALQNYNNQLRNPSSSRWVWVCPFAYGEPYLKSYPLEDYTWVDAKSGEANWNLLTEDGCWQANDGATTFDHARSVTIAAEGSLALNVPETIASVTMSVSQPENATFTLKGKGQVRLSQKLDITQGTFRTEVGGGVGHDGLEFTEKKGNVVLAALEKYYPAKLVNVDTVTLAGANALLDFRKVNNVENLQFDTLTFAGTDGATCVNNILRSDYVGALTKYLPFNIENTGVRLETLNAFKDATNEKDFITLNNGSLTVAPSPNYGKAANQDFEEFLLPMAMNNSTFTVDITKNFSFGSATNPGYSILVSGESGIASKSSAYITLYGITEITLDSGAILNLSAEMVKGDENAGIHIKGNGTVKIKNAKALTGNVTIDSGVMIEFEELPLQSVKTLSILSGAEVVLPADEGGAYQIIPVLGSTLLVGDNVKFSARNRQGEKESFDCDYSSNGMVFLKGKVLTWNVGMGTWSTDSASTPWSGSAFSNGKGVYFGDVTDCSQANVTVSGGPVASFGAFGSANTEYTLVGADNNARALFQSLNVGGTVNFNLPVYSDGAVNVMSGKTEINASSPALNAKGVVVYDGATFGTSSMIRKLDTIRYIRVYFLSNRGGENDQFRFDEFSITIDGVEGWSVGRSLSASPAANVTNIGNMTNGDWDTSPSRRETGKNVVINCDASDVAKKNVYITIELSSPIKMFDHYGFYASKFTKPVGTSTSITDEYYPNRWEIAVSLDGVTYTSLGEAGYADTENMGGWYGYNRSHYAVSIPAEDANGSVEVLSGGKLLARGEYAVDLKFNEGAIIKAVNGAALDATKVTRWEFPEMPIKIDTSALTLSNDSQAIIENAPWTLADIRKFETMDPNASLRLSNGTLSVVSGDNMSGPYMRVLDGECAWDDLNEDNELRWMYDANTVDENGNEVFTPFTKKWSENKLEANADVLVYARTESELTLDCDVLCYTFGANTARNGCHNLTIKSDGKHTITAATLDFSGFTCEFVYEPDCGSAHVIAGPTTYLKGTGTGILEVGEGNTVVLSQPWQGTIIGNGTIILDPGEGKEWTDLNILKCNTTSTIALGSGSMQIAEGTDWTVAGLSVHKGATIVTAPTSSSWVLAGKNVTIDGTLEINADANGWMTNLDYSKIAGTGTIAYVSDSGTVTDLPAIAAVSTLKIAIGRGNFDVGAVSVPGITIKDGATFSATSLADTSNIRYIRIYFFAISSGSTVRLSRIRFSKNGQNISWHGATVTASQGTTFTTDSGVGSNDIVNDKDPDNFALNMGWDNGVRINTTTEKMKAGECYITIRGNNAVEMFDTYNFKEGKNNWGGYPTDWKIQVSTDGNEFITVDEKANVMVPSQDLATYGGTASRVAPLNVEEGGALLAKGEITAKITLDAGAMIKPVAGKSMTLASGSDLILPESGKVTIDMTGITGSSDIVLISGKAFIADDLAKFEVAGGSYRIVLGDNGSLKLTRTHFAPTILVW